MPDRMFEPEHRNGNSSPTVASNEIISLTRVVFLTATVFVLSYVVLGCVNEDDLTADQRMYQLSTQLMCPVCEGQTLDQSQAQLSLDMQAVIREKVEAGDSNTEIRRYFVDRYGEVVLASPDAEGFNLIAWLLPVAIFTGGLLVVWHAFRTLRRQYSGVSPGGSVAETQGQAPQTSKDDALAMYLERASREMEGALRNEADQGMKRRYDEGSE